MGDGMTDTLSDKILESRYDLGSGTTQSRIRLGLDDGLRLDICVSWSAVPDDSGLDRKSTRLNSSHVSESRMPSSA